MMEQEKEIRREGSQKRRKSEEKEKEGSSAIERERIVSKGQEGKDLPETFGLVGSSVDI